MISMQTSSYGWCKLVAVAASLLTVGSAYGDDLASARTASLIIKEFANTICTRVPLEVEGRTVELSGEAKAGLNEIISKFVNLGIQGAGRYQHETSKGFLREELAQAVKNSDDCRLAVFHKLIDRLMPAESPTVFREVPPPPAAFDISGRYNAEARYSITATGEGGAVGAHIEAVAGPRGTARMSSTYVLDIRSGSGGTFSGSLYDTERFFSFNDTPFYDLPNEVATVEGRLEGNKVTFVLRAPNGAEYMAVEGEHTGNSIKGSYTMLGPTPLERRALPFRLHPSLGVEQAAVGEFMAFKSISPPPGPQPAPAPMADPVPLYSPEHAQPIGAELCCKYSLGWCSPWGSTPRGSDSPTQLGSLCYCQDRPGIVVEDCQ